MCSDIDDAKCARARIALFWSGDVVGLNLQRWPSNNAGLLDASIATSYSPSEAASCIRTDPSSGQ